MKILEQTSVRLSFEDRSLLNHWSYYWPSACLYTLGIAIVINILFAPVTFFGFGSIWLVFTHEQKATLTCTRTESPPGKCQLVRSRFVGPEAIEFPLNDLQSATLESESRYLNRQAGKKVYSRVLLNTKTGSINLTVDDLENGAEQEKIATQINTFIKSPTQPFLKVQQKGMPLDWMMILVFITLSLIPILLPFYILLFALGTTTCTLDKTLGKFKLQHQWFKIFANKELFKSIIIEYPLAEIAEVEVEALPKNHRCWYIVAVMKSGKRLPIFWLATPGKEEKQAMANRIRRFLNLAAIDR